MKKVDLSILKRLVSELETTLAIADGMANELASNKIDYVVEMNKATGLVAGVLTEAGLLIGDIQYLVQGAATPSKGDLLDKFLGGLKGSGGTN